MPLIRLLMFFAAVLLLLIVHVYFLRLLLPLSFHDMPLE